MTRDDDRSPQVAKKVGDESKAEEQAVQRVLGAAGELAQNGGTFFLRDEIRTI